MEHAMEYTMEHAMEYKFVKYYENYKIYENGDIININSKTKRKIAVSCNNDQYRINLCKNGKHKGFTLVRLIYETYYNDVLTDNYIIRFKDENCDEKFHYKNLEKISRTDMFKKIDHDVLDINKEWKNIKNYDDYKISNYGDIFSVKSNQMLEPVKNHENYCCVKLISNYKRKSFPIHRLVYETFTSGIILNDKNIVDHIDGNMLNNHIDNLTVRDTINHQKINIVNDLTVLTNFKQIITNNEKISMKKFITIKLIKKAKL